MWFQAWPRTALHPGAMLLSLAKLVQKTAASPRLEDASRYHY